MANNPIAYEMLSPEGCASLVMFRYAAAPGQSTGPDALQHSGDENFFLLTGAVEVEVEGQKYKLGPGDSVFIPRSRRHQVTNVWSGTSEAIFVLSPPAC